MGRSLAGKLKGRFINWLSVDREVSGPPICDFDRIRYEIRPCDVLLIEGRNRISDIIKSVTQSSWSHASLYIGRIHDIEDPVLRELAKEFSSCGEDEQLIIESMLGQGTIIAPLSTYKKDHIRICRPQGIAREDAQSVIGYAINRLGLEYDVRHVFDLMRFLLPWSIIPKRWRSSLFEHNAGTPTRQICSSLLAEAFSSVHFPILPEIEGDNEGENVTLSHRNPRLFTPRDFDYSPYFEIIKYPFFAVSEKGGLYRRLPWDEETGTPHSSEEKEEILPEMPLPLDVNTEQEIDPDNIDDEETSPEETNDAFEKMSSDEKQLFSGLLRL